jgi:RNA polymerase sigma-70 factor (ECF subfamily)
VGATATATDGEGATVWALPFAGGDEELLEGLRAGRAPAIAAFYDRFAGLVLRVLARVLGTDAEIADIHQDVFEQAIASVAGVRSAAGLKAWVVGVAVHTARGVIRRRLRRRWLVLWAPAEPLEPVDEGVSPEVREALRATYAILGTLPADERIPFALRVIEGMELTEVAAACGTSLATIKRRLRAAQERFAKRAAAHPALAEWMEGGGGWRRRSR